MAKLVDASGLGPDAEYIRRVGSSPTFRTTTRFPEVPHCFRQSHESPEFRGFFVS